ncbi:MAG: thioredoxin [Chlorobiaceae bacterium]
MDSKQPFDFQLDVIAQSHDIPVVVDFWAEWCAPCRILTPLLEKHAEKNTGRWKFIKINTEEHPELISAYKIKSIPTVKLFVKGEVSSEFSGALPEYQLEEWLKKEIPSPYEKEILLAGDFVLQGKPVMAISLLDGVLHKEPENLKARALLVKLRLFLHPEEAVRLINPLENEPEYAELTETVKVLGRLLLLTRENLPDDSIKEDYLSAVNLLREENFAGALDSFIDVIRRHRYYDDDGARKACIAIFRFLGEEHEITRKHRKSFDRAF